MINLKCWAEGGFGFNEERPEYRARSLAFLAGLGDASKPAELVID